MAAVVWSYSPLDKVHSHPSRARCPATPGVSRNHLRGRRWLSAARVNLEDGLKQWLSISLREAPWWQHTEPCSSCPAVLLQPESAHPAWQGRAKVPAYLFSQPACSLASLCGHQHHGDHGTRPPAETRAPNTGPGALTAVPALVCVWPNICWLAWRNSALCKCLARLTKSCLETKSIQSCFPLWANQQRSCG